ncbi:MAG: hypothetical protein KDB94_13990 [Acidobacteria bacterium]|nr:hypothetical protein [Acidobacteriota bacterium]MCB9378641.1 hypothetical protein [Holophagales bacterium]
MKRTTVFFFVLAAMLATFAAADDPAKQPKDAKRPALATPPAGQATVVAPAATGYDIAIVALSSTGPEGSPPEALKVTFENKGTQPLDHDLFLQAKIAGQPAMLRSIHIRLQPGARQVWTNGYPAEAHLYPWGTDVWAKIDAQGTLREDDERNNEMSKVLQKFATSRPAASPRP